MTDAAGLKTSCSFTVTVLDTEKPVVNCPANIVASNDPGTCSRANVLFTATASDNCPGVTIAYSIAPGSTFPVGTTPVTVTATDASGNQTTCTFTVTINLTENPGGLYPIALNAQTLAGVAPGSLLPDIFNGTQPGNFGWLTWAGSPNEPTVSKSLTPPGDSFTYKNPSNAADNVISIGDWVQGKPGVSNSNGVRNALDVLKTIDINVPIWDQTTGNGNNTKYRVVGFAKVRIVSYLLPGQNRISARYLGSACGP
ncbi:MAG: HYR domain-containing protein [Verrucomicrobiota bacterium]